MRGKPATQGVTGLAGRSRQRRPESQPPRDEIDITLLLWVASGQIGNASTTRNGSLETTLEA